MAAVKPVATTTAPLESEDATATVACAPTVSDDAAVESPVPPAVATVSDDAAVAVPVVLVTDDVKTGVVRCEVAPAEGASRMSVCTAVPDVPAVFVLK